MRMGCPICGGDEGYYGGSNLPCKLCRKDFEADRASGRIPAIIGIDEWGEARRRAEAALDAGKSMAEAKRIAADCLNELAEKKRRELERTRQPSVEKTKRECLRHIFD